MSAKSPDDPPSVRAGAYGRLDDPGVLVARERDPLTGRLTSAGDDRPGKRRRARDNTRPRPKPRFSPVVVAAGVVIGVLAIAGVALAVSSGGGDDDKTSAGPPAGAPAATDTGGNSSGGDEIDLTGVDPCSLIDEATVQGLTGESTPFASQATGLDDTCFWGSTRAGVGGYVEVTVSPSDGLAATGFDLGRPCSVAPSGAVGEEAEIVTCPAGGNTPQPKVAIRAFERGVIVTVLVNDASGPVAEGELARVAGSVLSQLG